ncbi:MAG: IPT/TIG domain-containing protein [Acidobacteriota bacterium]
MRILGPGLGRSRYFTLPIIFVLSCSIASFGRKPNISGGHRGSSSLAISSLGPNSGPTAGGTTVTIAGTGFTHSASVAFGGVSAPAVIYVSSTELQAITPAHAGGTVSVAVTESPHRRSETLSGGFTYKDSATATLTVSSVSPTQGPTTGGTVVAVNGAGFQTGATVSFGSVQSTAVTFVSSTVVDAMAPPESSGSVAITVTDPNSQLSSLPSAFTYTSGPSVSSVSPTSGPATGGTTVTIMGSGFQNGAAVMFGTSAAESETFVSSSEIQAVTPGSTAGTVAITIANPDSQSGTLSSAYTFFHTVSLSWTASPSTTITGYNLYRSSTSGGPYAKINSAIVPGTTFTDDTVQEGYTYFYVATAVNGSNSESGYSNQAQVIVPSP